MIKLNDSFLIARSKNRNCYLNPVDPHKVIKIVNHNNSSGMQDANFKEWAYYKHLKQYYPQFKYISKYHGFVETNMGQGLLADCIMDYNGHISRRLQDVLINRSEYDIAAIEKLINRFCRKIIETNIKLFDLNLFNILIQTVSADRNYRLFCVDIKGPNDNSEFIPVSSYIPFFSRQKIKRRCRRLIQKVRNYDLNETK